MSRLVTADPEPLLIEWVASKLGFERLGTIFPGDGPYPPALLLGTVLFLDFGVGNTARHLFTSATHGLVSNPFSAAIPLGLILAIVGIRFIDVRLEGSVRNLKQRQETDIDVSEQGFSFSTKAAVYLLCLGGMYGYIAVFVGFGSLMEARGALWAVVTTFGFGPVYILVAVEAVLMYVAVHVVLPRQLARTDQTVHFLDPRNLGGFQPFGNLLKRTYYLYTAGLILYLTWIYAPHVLPFDVTVTAKPGLPEAAFFTGLWLLGLGTLGYSIHTVHRLMAREKERKIAEIEEELQAVVDNPYDIGRAQITDREQFEEVQQRLDYVRATSTYPTTFTMWVQILMSVVIPQIVQLSLSATV